MGIQINTLFDHLQKRYSGRVELPADVSGILPGFFYVYILTVDGQPIIVGHGKKNRAQVIFDSETSATSGHIKALMVRLHLRFASDSAVYGRYLIQCASKAEAQEIEAELHQFGGNTLRLPDAVR